MLREFSNITRSVNPSLHSYIHTITYTYSKWEWCNGSIQNWINTRVLMMKIKTKSLFALILRQILFNTAKLQEHLQRPTEHADGLRSCSGKLLSYWAAVLCSQAVLSFSCQTKWLSSQTSIQNMYECSVYNCLASDLQNLLHHDCATYSNDRRNFCLCEAVWLWTSVSRHTNSVA